MPKTQKLFAGLVAVVALAGCSAGEAAGKDEAAQEHVQRLETDVETMKQRSAGEATPAAEPAPAPAPDLGDVSAENTWAEKQLRDFMIYVGANSLEAWPEDAPERNIIAVTNPEDGVVRFEIADRQYGSAYFLEALAANYMSFTGCAAEDVDAVIVETESGSRSVTRDHCG